MRVLERLAAFALIVGGVYLVSLPVALIVAGALLLVDILT